MRCPYCGAEIEKSILKRVICMKCFRWVDVEETPAVHIPENPPQEKATLGVEYRIENQTAVVSGYHGTDSSVVIAKTYGPYRVTAIKERAFADNRCIEVLKIPDSVEMIGKEACSNCLYLKEVSLGDGIRRIEAGAFYHCVSLERVIYEKMPLYVSVSAFSGCYNLAADVKNEMCLKE